ncbi:MAG: NADH-quinone oxidoreductase subunit NuoN [Proteobacteria bacterium]|nr:NADH-quinone oxidoreductase subunit NuoN [Pseudomonadota bacterium]
MAKDILVLGPAWPEVFLACAAMALLMLGVFRGESSARLVSWLSVGALAATALLLSGTTPERGLTFGGMFVIDSFAVFMKMLVLLGSALAIVMSLDFNEREKIARFEYPVLFLFATLGMMMMVSASDLISLYLGLELQSLSLYVVAAFRRDSIRSTEAGLKYFVLGALSSGLLLYGASLIYGFAGTTSFAGIARIMVDSAGDMPLGVVFGVVFIAAALAFKVSAAPFHMWTPDVYEGAPTPVTAFFSVAPKIAAVSLLVRVLVEPFGPLVGAWQQIVVALAVVSMLIGGFAAIYQTNIKRLMAYSSIGHIGYALVGLAAGDETGVRGVLVYMSIYLFMNVAAFGAILCMRQQGRMVERIDDLSGLAKNQPMVAAALAISMFSMAGIPPLAGFFGKLYVFLAAISAGLYALAVIGVLTSVVAAYYYLRIVKLMYFDDPVDVFDQPIGRPLGLVLAGTSLFTLLFFVYPAPLIFAAGLAAAALYAG